jgi:hypothetical protein
VKEVSSTNRANQFSPTFKAMFDMSQKSATKQRIRMITGELLEVKQRDIPEIRV